MNRVWRRLGVAAGALLLCVLIAGAVLYLRPLAIVDAAVRLRFWSEGVSSKYVEVDGMKLHYLEAKPHDKTVGTPLLLVHGLGARGDDWGQLIPGLAAAGFHVYAPDLPGYGRSDKPDVPYTIAYEEAAVINFARALKLSRADVAGWSMGGWVAMKIAADEPSLVDRLVLYDSAGVYFPYDYDASLFTPTDEAGFDRLLTRLTPKRAHVPSYIARDFLRRSARNGWVIKRSVAAMMSGRDLMEFRLHQIHQPTAVFWGTKDELIPPTAGQKIARGIGSNAAFVPLDGCGHLAPTECIGQALPKTIQFLRGEPGR